MYLLQSCILDFAFFLCSHACLLGTHLFTAQRFQEMERWPFNCKADTLPSILALGSDPRPGHADNH
jgi:hypothetical protein